MTKISNKSNVIKYIVKIAILSALAAVIMFFEFPLPFAPSFYELNFSEVIVLIGGFALGPVAGVFIELFKVLIVLLFKGTTTVFVGEAANFIVGCAFVVPAALIYKYRKKISGAVIGMIVGTVVMACAGAFINYYVLIPTYSEVYGMPLDSIIAAGSAVNKYVTNLKTLIMWAVVPFNLLKGVASSAITALLYKRVSPILHK